MKCKFVLLVFCGAVAAARSKPMAMMDNDNFQLKSYYYYEARNGSITKITGDVDELCQGLAALDNSGRTVPRQFYVEDFKVYYICDVAETDPSTTIFLNDDDNIHDSNTQKQTETILLSNDKTTATSKLLDLSTESGFESKENGFEWSQPTNTEKEADSTPTTKPNSDALDELFPTTTELNIIFDEEINNMLSEELSDSELSNTLFDDLTRLEHADEKIHEATTVTAPNERLNNNWINQDLSTESGFESKENGFEWSQPTNTEKEADSTPTTKPNSDALDELFPTTTELNIIFDKEINNMLSEELSDSELSNTLFDDLTRLEHADEKIHEATTVTAPNERLNNNWINQEPSVTRPKYIREGYKFHSTVNGWMKLHLMPASWTDARLRCLREGSTLASPVDLPMLEAMKEVLDQKASIVFTGVSENYAPGFFYSVEGVSLDNMPASFVPGQPDFKQGIDQCVRMFANGTMTLSRCDTLSSFICYVKDSDVPENESPCGPDPNYTLDIRTGQCYKFHTFGRTWTSAFMTCATEGGHLAVINSDEEANVLVELVNKNAESTIRSDYPSITLLGFRDWSEHNTWMTIHGQTLQKAGYSDWGQDEPNDARSEFCGAMFRTGKLNDTLCGTPMPFVCEKKPNSPRI